MNELPDDGKPVVQRSKSVAPAAVHVFVRSTYVRMSQDTGQVSICRNLGRERPVCSTVIYRLEIYLMRKTLSLLAAAGAALALAACGHNMQERAATGGIAGAAVAGPVGAVAGAAGGAAVSAATDSNKH
jgi:hypothetical protein